MIIVLFEVSLYEGDLYDGGAIGLTDLAAPVRQKIIINGGGHSDLRARPEYRGIVNDFIGALDRSD
ncbi:MAG: hypothetical protein V4577_04545 [Bacteroidota bacterium]